MIEMPKLTTLVYCIDHEKVLLIQRKKKPFVGYWVAPGGKLEAGESPYQCAVRELQEETGLSAHHLHLRGIVTETSALPDWQWLMFIYVVTHFSGTLIHEGPEGKLHWWSFDPPKELDIPEADRIFLPKILDLHQPIYQATYYYDDHFGLDHISEHST